jgi:TPP-dependent pyruvate/acetoin dehydrogenase alpha subunit
MTTRLEGISVQSAVAMHRTMVRIRVFEERISELFLQGVLPGFVHTYIGQEAIAAGVCAALNEHDYITSTHRGHGHAIAKGMSFDVIMAELYGKATGACRGRGGSMHVADFSLGMLGANGIVGGGFGIAAGAALSARYRGTDQVAVCFFGDGAVNKGTFHEALNFAAVRDLPAVFVCENNRYAQFTAASRTTSVEDLAVRAAAYGIPGVTVDGNAAADVHRAAAAAVERARKGAGPTLLNLRTYRFGGHYVGDAEVYRDKEEVEKQRAVDPINRWESLLADEGVLDAHATETVWAEARVAVAAAEQFAEESPYPDPDSALDWVFTEGPAK